MKNSDFFKKKTILWRRLWGLQPTS